MRSRITLVLAAVFLLQPTAVRAEKKSSGVPRFDAAVERGAAFLKNKIAKDSAAPGHLVLSAYALFKSGEPVESPIVQAGLKKVLDSATENGFHPHSSYDHLYEAGLFAMFLADVDQETYKPQIQQIANYVVSVQHADGSFSDSPTAVADVSMCQYAVLAIWAAQRAGCQVSPEALDKVSTFLMSRRNSDGGWTYRPGTSIGTTGANSSRNMTMAALSSLGVTRLLFYGPQKLRKEEQKKDKELAFGVLEKNEDPTEPSLVGFPDYKPQNSFGTLTAGIERSMAYETANFNPVNVNQNFPIYFYYSAERALAVSEIDEVAKRDWYTTYGDGLLSLQNQDGAWNETFSGEIIGTSFAILYFMRSTKQIIDKSYGLGIQQGKKGNPFGDKETKREPTELDLLIADMEKMDTTVDESPIDVADEIVRSVTSIDDPEKLVGQEEKLKSLMKHPNADVRKSVVWALGRTGDFKLVPLMLDGIRDPSVDVNIEAIQALRFISRKPRGFGESLAPFASLGTEEQIKAAAPEERLKLATPWREKALKDWSNWYFRIRPHEEQDGFDQLLLAVPLSTDKADASNAPK